MRKPSLSAVAFFNVPLNLPHAATIATRIVQRIDQRLAESDASEARMVALEIADLLSPYRMFGDPEAAEAMVVKAEALDKARLMVGFIASEGLGSDRLGQAVRNLFECLGAGEEGAEKGLQAGEDPNSLQRP